MDRFMTFDANVRHVFNDDANDFVAFSQLLTDTANHCAEVPEKEANSKIVEVFRSLLGLTKESKGAEIRRAIRRNQALLFDVIEETLQNLLMTGWQNDPFMMAYVDQRNLALGDQNSFYIEDESVLSVMKVSGNHHDIKMNSVRTI